MILALLLGTASPALQSPSAEAQPVADESTAFAAAMDRAMVTGQPLVLDAGRTYRLSRWIAKSLSAPLRIDGNGAILIGPANVDFVASSQRAGARPVDISGVTFEGWRSIINFRDDNVMTYGGNADGMRFAHNIVRHQTGYAINVESPSRGYLIEGNTIEGGANGIRVGWNSLAAANGWQGRIAANSIGELTGTGADLHGIIAYGFDTAIENNTIRDLTARGRGSVFGIYTKLVNSSVSRNGIFDLSGSGPESVAIDLKGTEEGDDRAPHGYGTSAVDNLIRGNGAAGRGGLGIRLQSDGQKAIGNTIENFGKSALVIDESEGQSDIEVRHNIVVGTNAAGERGIEISSLGPGRFTRHVTIAGNVVKDCTEGLYLGGAGIHEDIEIVDNEFDAGPAGGAAGINIANDHEIRGLTMSRNRIVGRFANGLHLAVGLRPGWSVEGNEYR